ncbi:MAG TPA: hypothetical protein VIP77_23700, partial [Jiangellaceae bacterium]
RPRTRPPRRHRHQRLQNSPHLIRNLHTRHTPSLTDPSLETLDQHALAKNLDELLAEIPNLTKELEEFAGPGGR